MKERAALILSGGTADRFQQPNQPWQDKALAKIDGHPLLIHVIGNLMETVETIAVCVNDKTRMTGYKQLLENYRINNIKFVLDQKNKTVKGPLLAIASGLKAVNATHCLVVPTDMPFLKPEVANLMLNTCKEFDVVAPMWPNGTIETLLMALNRKKGVEITQTLCDFNKAYANGILRAACKVRLLSPLQEIKQLDPKLESFTNINTQEELSTPTTRSIQGTIDQNIDFKNKEFSPKALQSLRKAQKMQSKGKMLEARAKYKENIVNLEAKNCYFWAGISNEKLAEIHLELSEITRAKATYKLAAKNYKQEANDYRKSGCKLLAERATFDYEKCESKSRI